MSNFENYDFILHDGVVIENEKADKEGRKGYYYSERN